MDQIDNPKKPISPRYFQSTEMLHMTEHMSPQNLRKTLSITNLQKQEFLMKNDCNVCKKRADIVSFYMKLREDLEGDIKTLRSEKNLLQTNLANEASKIAHLEQKLMSTELELSKLKANKQKIIINHDHQLEDINKENMSLRNEIWQNRNDFNIQIGNLKNELLDAKSSVLAKEHEFKLINSNLKSHIIALEKELNIMQLQLMDAAAQIEKHEAVNELLKSQVDSLTTNNDNLTQIIANKLESDSIQASVQHTEVPQTSEAFLEMMQTELNMNNGQTFTTKFLKLLKKYVRHKKTNKPSRINGSLNSQKK